MRPALQEGQYVFLTSKEPYDNEVQSNATMIFRESEGMTVIVKDEIARTLDGGSQPRWAMITLTVHSDLAAVGFLAAITRKLADAGISVNPVSAFYHDHLFVPWETREEAMTILSSLQM